MRRRPRRSSCHAAAPPLRKPSASPQRAHRRALAVTCAARMQPQSACRAIGLARPRASCLKLHHQACSRHSQVVLEGQHLCGSVLAADVAGVLFWAPSKIALGVALRERLNRCGRRLRLAVQRAAAHPSLKLHQPKTVCLTSWLSKASLENGQRGAPCLERVVGPEAEAASEYVGKPTSLQARGRSPKVREAGPSEAASSAKQHQRRCTSGTSKLPSKPTAHPLPRTDTLPPSKITTSNSPSAVNGSVGLGLGE